MNKLLKTALLLGGAALSIKALDTRLETSEYVVSSSKIPKVFDGFKIVHLTDLHSDTVTDLISQISAEDPDIIVCTGDMADDKGSYIPALRFVEKICKIAPCYMITGNHDVWRYDFEQMESEMTNVGAVFLRNERTIIRKEHYGISLCGIDDPYSCGDTKIKECIDNALKKIPREDMYEILLFHRANLLDLFADSSFDLILSGHMHGGHVRIPGVGGVISPFSSCQSGENFFFPSYFSGRHKIGDADVIVSRGLGNPTVVPRIFNRPEMCVIKLKSVKE